MNSDEIVRSCRQHLNDMLHERTDELLCRAAQEYGTGQGIGQVLAKLYQASGGSDTTYFRAREKLERILRQ